MTDEGEEEGDEGYGTAGSTPVSAAGGYDYPPPSAPVTHSYQNHNPQSSRNHNSNYHSPPRTRVHQYSNSGATRGGSEASESVTSPSPSQSYGRGNRQQRYQVNEPSSYFHNSMHHPRTPANGNYYHHSPASGSNGGYGQDGGTVRHYNHHHDGREAEVEGVDDEAASSDDAPTPNAYYNPVPPSGPGLRGYQTYHPSSPHSDYYDTTNDDGDENDTSSSPSSPSSSSNVHFPSRRRYY